MIEFARAKGSCSDDRSQDDNARAAEERGSGENERSVFADKVTEDPGREGWPHKTGYALQAGQRALNATLLIGANCD